MNGHLFSSLVKAPNSRIFTFTVAAFLAAMFVLSIAALIVFSCNKLNSRDKNTIVTAFLVAMFVLSIATLIVVSCNKLNSRDKNTIVTHFTLQELRDSLNLSVEGPPITSSMEGILDATGDFSELRRNDLANSTNPEVVGNGSLQKGVAAPPRLPPETSPGRGSSFVRTHVIDFVGDLSNDPEVNNSGHLSSYPLSLSRPDLSLIKRELANKIEECLKTPEKDLADCEHHVFLRVGPTLFASITEFKDHSELQATVLSGAVNMVSTNPNSVSRKFCFVTDGGHLGEAMLRVIHRPAISSASFQNLPSPLLLFPITLDTLYLAGKEEGPLSGLMIKHV